MNEAAKCIKLKNTFFIYLYILEKYIHTVQILTLIKKDRKTFACSWSEFVLWKNRSVSMLIRNPRVRNSNVPTKKKGQYSMVTIVFKEGMEFF